MYAISAISAQTLGVLCYDATNAGMCEAVGEYARPSGRDSGKYQRLLTKSVASYKSDRKCTPCMPKARST